MPAIVRHEKCRHIEYSSIHFCGLVKCLLKVSDLSPNKRLKQGHSYIGSKMVKLYFDKSLLLKNKCRANNHI